LSVVAKVNAKKRAPAKAKPIFKSKASKNIKQVLKIPVKTINKVKKVMKKVSKAAHKIKHPTPVQKKKLSEVAVTLLKFVSEKEKKVIDMISYVQNLKAKLEHNLKEGGANAIQNSLQAINGLLQKLIQGKAQMQGALKTIASFKDQILGF